jgi:hypothetical protein
LSVQAVFKVEEGYHELEGLEGKGIVHVHRRKAFRGAPKLKPVFSSHSFLMFRQQAFLTT